MPSYRISVVNKHFKRNEDFDAPNADLARAQALRGALQIGVDEVCSGAMFFGAQISIESESAGPVRLLIAIGASPLQ